MKQNKNHKIIIITLSVLLALSLLALAGTWIHRYVAAAAPADVTVPDNIITPDAEQGGPSGTDQGDAEPALENGVNGSANSANTGATGSSGSAASSGRKAAVISLYQRHAEDNKPFQVGNMFPGDVETKYYCVRVSHSGDVVVHYRADVRPGYEKLAEVLRCRIVLLTTGETLYDGLMRDMPESLKHSVKTNSDTVSELYYEITAYLDTSVGNDYQNKDLIADFRWWVQDTGNLNPPQTGDTMNLWLYIAIASGSMVMILLLLGKKRRKEECENG